MSQFEEFWQDLDARRRAGLVLGVLVIVGLAIGVLIWSSDRQQAVLSRDLAAHEVSAIVQSLQEGKIDYQVSQSGDAVLVDAGQLGKARSQLAKSGVNPGGQVGFELFDNVDYGMSEFSQKIYLQRALQGEIARTIIALDEIKSARVHLVLPESSLFNKDEQVTKAAVTVVPVRGQVLSESQIKGIQVLVASSVRELTPDRVLITDQQGNPLSRSGDSAITSNRLEEKQEVERYLVVKAQEILEQVYGPGRSLIKVDVELNHERIERQTERVLPANENGDGFILEKRETSKEADSSKSASKGSAARVTRTSEVKYAVGRSVEQYVKESGGIKRLSVSVLVPDAADAKTIQGLRSLIASAVGLNPSRGDSIEIHGIQKAGSVVPASGGLAPETAPNPVSSQTEAPLVASWMAAHPNVRPVLSGVAVVVVVLILLGVFRALFKGERNSDLSSSERDALLIEVKDWLRADTESPELKS